MNRIDELVATLRRPLAGLPRELELCPVAGPFDVRVRPPGSKSLTNRALLLAALAEGPSVLRGALVDADDARVMIEALGALGVRVEHEPADPTTLRIQGVGGRLRGGRTLSLQNAGTATRFLTAAACLADAPVIVDGSARMRQRPIGELVSMLRALGVRIDELGAPGCVPLRVHPGRPDGGVLRVGATQSSQFLSALLLIGPWCARGVRLEFDGVPTSAPYIDMTAGLIRGCSVAQVTGTTVDGWIEVRPVPPARGFAYDVEPDASGAAAFWAGAAAVPGATARVVGLDDWTLQQDAFFTVALRAFGAQELTGVERGVRGPRLLTGGTLNLSETPDAAMAAACVAALATGPSRLRGVRTLRVKETDRAAALQVELAKVGVRVSIEAETGPNGGADETLAIAPPPGGVDGAPDVPRVVFETYDDHRMAMALAIIGLRRPNVVIRDPGCVAKTYPTFWSDWARLYERGPA